MSTEPDKKATSTSASSLLEAEYLTTQEVAELLRIKERKVYDLAASGRIPCSRATGKLLFPRELIVEWLSQHQSGSVQTLAQPRNLTHTQNPQVKGAKDLSAAILPAVILPAVILGSHDPLLEWALRESGCGIPTLLESSEEGMRRFLDGDGIASGIHIYSPDNDTWNLPAIGKSCAGRSVVLVEWAKRQRGLILGKNVTKQIDKLSDIQDLRLVPRQTGSGSQCLLVHLLRQLDISVDELEQTREALSESDAAVCILDGSGDVTFGLESLAMRYKLRFVPLIEERFDLLVDRRAWFEPQWQTLLTFCQSEAFVKYAALLPGYDISQRMQVHFNGN